MGLRKIWGLLYRNTNGLKGLLIPRLLVQGNA